MINKCGPKCEITDLVVRHHAGFDVIFQRFQNRLAVKLQSPEGEVTHGMIKGIPVKIEDEEKLCSFLASTTLRIYGNGQLHTVHLAPLVGGAGNGEESRIEVCIRRHDELCKQLDYSILERTFRVDPDLIAFDDSPYNGFYSPPPDEIRAEIEALSKEMCPLITLPTHGDMLKGAILKTLIGMIPYQIGPFANNLMGEMENKQQQENMLRIGSHLSEQIHSLENALNQSSGHVVANKDQILALYSGVCNLRNEQKELFEGLRKVVTQEQLDAITEKTFQQINALQSREQFQQNLRAVQQGVAFVGEVIARVKPEMSQQFNTVTSATITFYENYNHLKGVLSSGFSLAALGPVAGMASAVLSICSLFVRRGPDPLRVISNQIQQLAEMTSQLRNEMHGRFNRLEKLLVETQKDVLENFSILATQQIRFQEGIRLAYAEMNTRIQNIQQGLTRSFAQAAELRFSELFARVSQAVEDHDMLDQGKYNQLISDLLVAAEVSVHHANLTGLWTEDRQPLSALQALKNKELGLKINYITHYFNGLRVGHFSTNLPHPSLWLQCIFCYLTLRRKKYSYDSALGEGHYANFQKRLFSAGLRLKETVTSLQENTRLRNRLFEDYRSAFQELEDLGWEGMQNEFESPRLLPVLSARFEALYAFCELAFHQSLERDVFFASLLRSPYDGLPNEERLRFHFSKFWGGEGHKKSQMQEYFFTQKENITLFERILTEKAEGMQVGASREQHPAVELGLRALRQFEQEFYQNKPPTHEIAEFVPHTNSLDCLPTCANTLFSATKLGCVDQMKALLPREGKNRDRLGRYAIHYAAAYGSCEVVQLFTGHTPTPRRITDGKGNIPLHFSARTGNVGPLAFFISPRENNRALFVMKNQFGITPFELAFHEKHKEFVRYAYDCFKEESFIDFSRSEIVGVRESRYLIRLASCGGINIQKTQRDRRYHINFSKIFGFAISITGLKEQGNFLFILGNSVKNKNQTVMCILNKNTGNVCYHNSVTNASVSGFQILHEQLMLIIRNQFVDFILLGKKQTHIQLKRPMCQSVAILGNLILVKTPTELSIYSLESGNKFDLGWINE